jgi:hypothetical protein
MSVARRYLGTIVSLALPLILSALTLILYGLCGGMMVHNSGTGYVVVSVGADINGYRCGLGIIGHITGAECRVDAPPSDASSRTLQPPGFSNHNNIPESSSLLQSPLHLLLMRDVRGLSSSSLCSCPPYEAPPFFSPPSSLFFFSASIGAGAGAGCATVLPSAM